MTSRKCSKQLLAQEVLVHNYVIIDDPRKDFVDAHSKAAVQTKHGKNKSVTITRLHSSR